MPSFRARMVVRATLAPVLTLAGAPAPAAATGLGVLTWNTCAATNPACRLYRADTGELARAVTGVAAGGPIRPDVILLQEFCSGASHDLERELEARTGRPWTVGSWSLLDASGEPYPCHPDRQGRPRGAQSVTVAVARPHAVLRAHPLPSPPWYARRGVLCATLADVRVHACGTHLSAGTAYDDRQPGAPYRAKQVRRLLDVAVRPGHWAVFGGDLNAAPPGSRTGSAAGKRAVAPAYRGHQECDQRGRERSGRWTHTGRGGRKKLDYLFAPPGSVRRCHVDHRTTLSDHQPLSAELILRG